MSKPRRVLDFEERAKTVEGRGQLADLRNGEIDTMRANSASYLEDMRRKQVYRAWEENCQWVRELNEVLGLIGYGKSDANEIWKLKFGYN